MQKFIVEILIYSSDLDCLKRIYIGTRNREEGADRILDYHGL